MSWREAPEAPARELEDTRARLAEAEETISALRRGEADAILVEGNNGPRVYTLTSADEPYRLIVERMREAALTVAGDGTILYCNDAFAALAGREAARIVGGSLDAFVGSDAICDLTSAGGCRGREFTFRARECVRTCHGSSVPMEIDDLTVFCLQFTDLTGQRLRLRHDAIVRAADGAIYSLSPDLTIESWNPGACKMLGWTKDEAVGRPERDFCPPGEVETLDALVARMLETGEPASADTRRLCRNGEEVDVMLCLAPTWESDGSLVGFVAIGHDISERIRTERALKESERKFREVFTHIDEGYCLCEMIVDDRGNAVDYRFLEVNPLFESFTGLRDPVGKTALELVPDLERHWIDVYARVGLGRETLRFEEGSEAMGRVFDVFATPVQPDGRFVIVFDDVTERRRAESELRDAESRRSFLLALGDSLRDCRGRFEVMRTASEMTGRRLGVAAVAWADIDPTGEFADIESEWNDGTVSGNVARHRLADFGEEFAAHLRSGGTLVVNDVSADDRTSMPDTMAAYRRVGAAAFVNVPLIREGRLCSVLGVLSSAPRVWTASEVRLLRQVAHRLWMAIKHARSEEALRESEAKLRVVNERFIATLEASPVVVFTQDRDLRYTWIHNPQLGYRVEEVIGRTDRDLVDETGDALCMEAIKRSVLRTGEPQREEVRVRRDGSETWYDLNVHPQRDESGEVVGVLCTAADITERKEREQQVELLMREVNHRTKNLLSVVQAVAKQTAATDPEDFVEKFSQRVHAMSASQDLLIRNDWQGVRIEELVRSQLAHLADLIGDRIRFTGLPVTVSPAGAQTIGMALHELATNAAKYGALSNRRGRVLVEWGLAGENGERFAMSWTERGGPAVSPPARKGFGSRVVGDMARMRLDAEVELDYAAEGLTWHLSCPSELVVNRSSAAAREDNVVLPGDPLPSAGRRVLVVEDEALLALDLGQALTDAGFEVVGPATSVEKALALIRSSGCDMAVLDINLGTGTAEPIAYELLARNTPFVAVTGYSARQRPKLFEQVPTLSKPVRTDMLVAELARYLAA